MGVDAVKEERHAVNKSLAQELDKAVYDHDVDIPKIIKLVRAGADPNLSVRKGSTPLHFASCNGTPAQIDELLDLGADIDLADDVKHTPLHYSLIHPRKDVIAKLLDRGANVQLKIPNGDDALNLAVRSELLDLVEAVIKHGADPKKHGIGADPAVFCAIRDKRPKLLALLMKHGADANLQYSDKNGNCHLDTPLHWAVRRDPVMVRTLLEHGADPLKKNSKGETPLDYARNPTHPVQDFEREIESMLENHVKQERSKTSIISKVLNAFKK